MSKTTVTFTVALTIEGDGTDAEDAGEMRDLFADYIASGEAPFAEDYSPAAWGGYEGPFVTDVTVTDDAGKITRARNWPVKEPEIDWTKPDDEND